MANEQRRIIGDDVGLYKGEIGTVLKSTGDTIPANQLVKIVAVGTKFANLLAGDYFIHTVGAGIVLAGADSCYLVTQNKMADITSATIDISNDKIDTTALADAFKVARSGKSDLTGTVEFVYIKGITDDTTALTGTGLLSAFFRTATIAANGTASVTTKSNTPWLLVLWLDETDTVVGNHKLLIVLQVEFESFTLGGSMGNAQTTSAPFHIVGGSPTTVYKVVNAV